MAAYTFLDLAYDVLKNSAKPLTHQEIWQIGKEQGLVDKVKTSGKTPWQTLAAQLYVDVRYRAESSRFMKIGQRPARFFLKERDLRPNALENIEEEQVMQKEKKTKFHERDLHPLLTYFASSNLSFNRGRSIYTKTIFQAIFLRAKEELDESKL